MTNQKIIRPEPLGFMKQQQQQLDGALHRVKAHSCSLVILFYCSKQNKNHQQNKTKNDCKQKQNKTNSQNTGTEQQTDALDDQG